MNNLPPFLACEVHVGGDAVTVTRRSHPMAGVRATTRRRSPLLGWMEWFDTRHMPANWQQPDFNATHWHGVVPVTPPIGPMRPASIASVPSRLVAYREIGRGPLARYFAPDTDDPPVAFFLADLECRRVPPQEVWRRYDLGKTRIARPRFVLDLPPGAVVQFGNTEELLSGRVAPWSALSGAPTCFVDHYLARGGVQEFFPTQAQGGALLRGACVRLHQRHLLPEGGVHRAGLPRRATWRLSLWGSAAGGHLDGGHRDRAQFQ